MALKTSLPFLFFIIVLFAHPVQVSAQHSGHSYDALAKDVLHLVNEYREKMGLGPLVMNEIVSEAATKHSSNMAMRKIPFGHQGFDARMAKIARQVKPSHAWAENVAEGPETAGDVVDLWLHSPGHRKNIEGDYNVTGIGIARGKSGDLYYTQIFVEKGK